MSIDRKLLWKAWPDGYLAMRGVTTVGGYDCVASRDGTLRWLPPCGVNHMPAGFWLDGVSPGSREAREKGDLLPNVDPADTATWACLKADLAEGKGHQDLVWRREQRPGYHPPNQRVAWRLCMGPTVLRNFYIDTENPALALVLARISLHKGDS